ncbi:MAG: phospholipase D-like domain-containing protein [Magnetococcus sp. YQC-5]
MSPADDMLAVARFLAGTTKQRATLEKNTMMRVTGLLIIALLLTVSTTAEAVEVCFTPGSDCTSVIVKAIREAKTAIRVQAYSFTSAPIAKGLIDAKRRKIDVKVILDKS